MLRRFKRVISSLFPFKIRRWLFHPLIVPDSYREEIGWAESILFMRHSGTNLDSEYWAAILRKYCHIIDKGLQRCDCETGHSQKYYFLAREALDKITEKRILDDPSTIWARNKIIEYEEFQNSICRDRECAPLIPTKCTFEQLYDVIQTRRSLRVFKNNVIARTDLEKIASVINLAPSSCNRQAAKVFIADSPELVQKCISSNSGATCLSDNIPCFMSFCVDLRPYDMPHEITLPILDTALGIQNCCLTAHSLGIGLTILNWTHHTQDQDEILRGALNIPSHYRIVANAVLGYPEKGAPTPSRKSPDITYVFSERGVK